MTDVKSIRRDAEFWWSVVRAALQAVAALILGTARYWDRDGKHPTWVIFAALILAGLLVYEPIRERRKRVAEGRTAHQHALVVAALGRLVAEVQEVSRAKIPEITAHVHEVERKRFRQQPADRALSRLERLVFNDSFGPTDIKFTASKGVIGLCLSEKRSIPADLVASKVNRARDEAAWSRVAAPDRLGLTWDDQRQLLNRRYGGLLAEPVRDQQGNVIAIVSLGVAEGLEANLQSVRIVKAMGTAAADVSRALGTVG